VQPASARRNALPALLAVAAITASCDKPRPRAAFERLRDRACACKALSCAELVELELGKALDQARARPVGGIAPIVAETRRCMSERWRASMSADLFSAEADDRARGTAPCDVFFQKADQILACDRTSIALRTRLALEVISIRMHWAADGTPRKPELELYDICLAGLSITMGAEDCSRAED